MEHPALRLGASLYVPATRTDLGLIGNGVRLPDVRSVIFCTEDAVSDADLPRALANLTAALSEFAPRPAERPLRFVRPRSDRVLAALLATPGIYNVDGFVLPKVTPASAAATLDLLAGSPFSAMITVETPEAFSTREMERLRDVVLESGADVLSVRVGGNDLLNLLGMRRVRGVTAYETPLGAVVDRLVGVFRPFGVNVSAPVYDFTDDRVTLAREAREDLLRGTFGKTAIHPDQVAVIEAAYVVTREEVVAAERILAPDAPAVFRVGGMMCEPATHRHWARAVLQRARTYGILDADAPTVPSAPLDVTPTA